LFNGWWVMSLMGMLFGPWIALTGMLRQREAFARHQALAFELQRSELERRALDAQLRLLQAQVEPHFLFNTLANVRALVKTGSPQAERVLGSLIAYLRAAVPRLDQPDSSFEHERQLVQAYLELMQMRMPDRLQFALAFDAQALPLACPPMAVLTLVENAVRHGIDPSESGGRVDVSVSHQASQCHVRVCDSGVGLGGGALQAGTGLWNLRERLQLAFAGQAQLRVMARPEGGTLAEIDLPARAVAAAHATAP
jgi:LytS/YehU family sensor histidine kinase